MRLRADLIREVHGALPGYCFLPERYKLDVTTSHDVCDHCDNRLHNQRIARRYPVGILLGRPELRHHIKKCPVCRREYPYEHPHKQLQLDNVMLRKHLTYFIFRWLDDYCCELKGEYFPFDQPSLVFYRRCVKLYDLLNELFIAPASFKSRERQTLASVLRVLESVKNDETLRNIAQRLVLLNIATKPSKFVNCEMLWRKNKLFQ